MVMIKRCLVFADGGAGDCGEAMAAINSIAQHEISSFIVMGLAKVPGEYNPRFTGRLTLYYGVRLSGFF